MSYVDYANAFPIVDNFYKGVVFPPILIISHQLPTIFGQYKVLTAALNVFSHFTHVINVDSKLKMRNTLFNER